MASRYSPPAIILLFRRVSGYIRSAKGRAASPHRGHTLSVDQKMRFAARNELKPGDASFTPLSVPEGSSGQSLDIQQ